VRRHHRRQLATVPVFDTTRLHAERAVELALDPHGAAVR
jgi:aspartate/glutamate racemase